MKHKYKYLLDVFECWVELTLVIVSSGEEISDAFDISVKIPIKKDMKSEQKKHILFCFINYRCSFIFQIVTVTNHSAFKCEVDTI